MHGGYSYSMSSKLNYFPGNINFEEIRMLRFSGKPRFSIPWISSEIQNLFSLWELSDNPHSKVSQISGNSGNPDLPDFGKIRKSWFVGFAQNPEIMIVRIYGKSGKLIVRMSGRSNPEVPDLHKIRTSWFFGCLENPESLIVRISAQNRNHDCPDFRETRKSWFSQGSGFSAFRNPHAPRDLESWCFGFLEFPERTVTALIVLGIISDYSIDCFGNDFRCCNPLRLYLFTEHLM